MSRNTITSAGKKGRLSIRVDPRRKAVITRAARLQGDSLSDFVVDTAYQLATELLTDECGVALNRKQIVHIFETLDRPPAKSVTAVRKLLTGRSILDG